MVLNFILFLSYWDWSLSPVSLNAAPSALWQLFCYNLFYIIPVKLIIRKKWKQPCHIKIWWGIQKSHQNESKTNKNTGKISLLFFSNVFSLGQFDVPKIWYPEYFLILFFKISFQAWEHFMLGNYSGSNDTAISVQLMFSLKFFVKIWNFSVLDLSQK